MDNIMKKAVWRAVASWIIFIIMIFIASSPEITNSGFSGWIIFISSIIFIVAVVLTITTYGAYLKSKLKKKK